MTAMFNTGIILYIEVQCYYIYQVGGWYVTAMFNTGIILYIERYSQYYSIYQVGIGTCLQCSPPRPASPPQL